jgi:di/tricarboxylate transporter
MAVVMGISVAALILFVFEVLTADLVALLAVIAVLLSGVVEPEQALAGFANPAVHTIAAMFIISAGLLKTGVVESFGRQLIRLAGRSPTVVFLVTLVTVVVLSAFINNTPIVVMMIPVVLGISSAHGFLPSKLLIPVSYASIMGGCCTLVGTSTNLVVSGMAVDAGLDPIGMFELAPVGLVMAAVGVLYLTLFARGILPDRETVTSHVSGGRIREYVTELIIRKRSALVGRRVEETPLARGALRALQVIRGEHIFWPPFGGIDLEAGDIIIAKGPASDIVSAGRTSGVELVPEPDARIGAKTHTIAEVVVTPGSRFEGASIREIGFRRHFDVSALAVERHGRHREREKVVDSRLRVGDVLLVQGDAGAVERLRNEEGIILLEGVESTVVRRHRAPIAVGITAAVILTATLTDIPIVACALTGAVLTVLSGCLSPRQLYRSVDLHTLVLIAGMIGLGHAASETGTIAWIAREMLAVIQPLGPIGVLAFVYLLTNVTTEFLSNAAAAVLMAPLAISTAQEMGLDERPFLVAVAFAASAAFSTPVGYQTNTIVYGPGGYRFSDYTKVGAPLNLAFWILATCLIPVFWPF